jgi:translation initiation factor IF-2
MQNVKQVKEGYECGMKIKVSKPILEGDILEFHEMQEVT